MDRFSGLFALVVAAGFQHVALADSWDGVAVANDGINGLHTSEITRVISGDPTGETLPADDIAYYDALYGTNLAATYAGVAQFSSTTTPPTEPITITGSPYIHGYCQSSTSYNPTTVTAPTGDVISLGPARILASNCGPGVFGGLYNIPITEFARASNVASLSGRVSAVESGLGAIGTLSAHLGALSTDLGALAAYVPAIQQQMEEATWKGAAMAAALDSVGPAAGKRNRLGTNAATVNGETAVAVNYVYSGDTLDVSAGVAYSEGEAISKVGLGFSW